MYLNPDVVGQSLQMKNGSWIARIGGSALFCQLCKETTGGEEKSSMGLYKYSGDYLFVGHWTVPERLSHTKVKGWPANWDCRICISLLTGIGLKREL